MKQERSIKTYLKKICLKHITKINLQNKNKNKEENKKKFFNVNY